MSPKIYEDFLPIEDFEKLKLNINSNYFPWYFSKCVDYYDTNQFIHNFFSEHNKSNFYPIVEKIVNKINPKILFRVKANLNVRTEKIIETGYHTDVEQKDNRFTSSIYFVNTCNGYCKIGDNKFYSKENTLITFKSNIEHTGSSCTDIPRRMVINFVYIDNL